ncbi:MAG: glycosyltransferase family 4 protein, partial [Kiritimatiellae bacterium]|nr:glycosyltransferase family 4 protein [Kiritimatiellia bacterium]
MRIAHVIRRISFSDWGGTEQVAWSIAKAQKAAGHDVRIFATSALCGEKEETREGLEISRFDPVYPWWPMPAELKAALDRKGGNPFVPGLAKALAGWRPDVIHSHAMARIAELCLRVAGKTGAKSVVSLHGGGANVPAEEAASLRAPTRWRLPWGKAVDILLRRTRRVPLDFGGIVCVGEDEYVRYRDIHPHVLFLPNGVDAGAFATCRPAPSPGRLGTVLCVARIDRQKNQMMLVEALARHPGLRVRLAGPVTQEDYREALLRRAAELGVSDRLVFTGALPPGGAELKAEFARADAFVLPSRHEPFGIAVLESWAAGLPVAASAVGGLGRLCAAHPGAAL